MFILKGQNLTQRILAQALACKKWPFQWHEKHQASPPQPIVGALALSRSNWEFLHSLSPIIGFPIHHMHLYYSDSFQGSLTKGLSFDTTQLGVDRLGMIVSLDTLNTAFPWIPSLDSTSAFASDRGQLNIATDRKARSDPQTSRPLGFSQQYIVRLKGKNLHHSAFQIFDWPNIFGILPLSDERFCIIWNQSTASPASSDQLEHYLDPLLAQLAITCTHIEEHGPAIAVSSYHSSRYFDDSSYLRMGEAAHHLHPVAGQGLNLTLRDFQAFLHLSDKHSPSERSYYVEKSRFMPNLACVNFCSHIVSPWARYTLPLAFQAPHRSLRLAKFMADLMQ